MENEIYNAFAEWLNKLLENDMPENIKTYNFNLYEEEDETYGIQLIASDRFDENDGGEWACSEIYSSEEDIFYIDHSDEKNAGRQRGMEFICGLIREYLGNGKYSDKLKNSTAVGAGFIDGDIEILFKK